MADLGKMSIQRILEDMADSGVMSKTQLYLITET